MESKANYMRVGLFVLLFSAGLIITALWLSIGFDKKTYKTYAVFMDEPVSGLSEQSTVKFNGVAVGYIKAIQLNKDNPQQVRILLDIEQGTPITTSTTATLKSQGITGITYLGLVAEASHANLLQKKPGQKYPVIPSRPSLLVQLDTALREASDNFREITRVVKHVFDSENAKALKASLEHLDRFTGVLARRDKEISQALINTNILLKNTAEVSNRFPELTRTLEQGVEAFKSGSLEVRKASNEVSRAMISARNTMKSFDQQAIPPAVSLIEKMEEVANNVNQLTEALTQNPSVIWRGRAKQPLGPGE